MLFNSYTFIYFFLPVCLLGFYLLRDKGDAKYYWLVASSLFFYGWWNIWNLPLLLISLAVNFTAQRAILNRVPYATTLGILFNLGFLFYFKYFNFFMDQVEIVSGVDYNFAKIILPLGISFFTFQKIALLVDTRQGKVGKISPLEYSFFTTFFPQLIAGPIVHYSHILPQLKRPHRTKREVYVDIFIGLLLFSIGLFKKVVLADTLGMLATPVFEFADKGQTIHFADAWLGCLAYTFQLYFDFSGYSDMAIGLARFFGFVLPINFASPYKSKSIVEFWRRWHITLSAFLRDYIYIPLGGNRKGMARRYVNVFVTMTLGGIWHGASWNFMIWGVMHGMMIIINQMWNDMFGRAKTERWISRIFWTGVTFSLAALAWVIFRAETLQGALAIYKTMFGLNGIVLPEKAKDIAGFLDNGYFTFGRTFNAGSRFLTSFLMLAVSALVVFCAPSARQLTGRIFVSMRKSKTEQELKYKFYMTALYTALVLSISIMAIGGKSEFLYFQF